MNTSKTSGEDRLSGLIFGFKNSSNNFILVINYNPKGGEFNYGYSRRTEKHYSSIL